MMANAKHRTFAEVFKTPDLRRDARIRFISDKLPTVHHPVVMGLQGADVREVMDSSPLVMMQLLLATSGPEKRRWWPFSKPVLIRDMEVQRLFAGQHPVLLIRLPAPDQAGDIVKIAVSGSTPFDRRYIALHTTSLDPSVDAELWEYDGIERGNSGVVVSQDDDDFLDAVVRYLDEHPNKPDFEDEIDLELF